VPFSLLSVLTVIVADLPEDMSLIILK